MSRENSRLDWRSLIRLSHSGMNGTATRRRRRRSKYSAMVSADATASTDSERGEAEPEELHQATRPPRRKMRSIASSGGVRVSSENKPTFFCAQKLVMRCVYAA